MSSFYAYDFMYDNIPSHRFDLKIITFEDGGLFRGVGSSDINILTQRVLRKSKPYYLGRTMEPVLEFPLTFGTASPISALDRDLISAWLFGRSTYKELYILQDDLHGAYFNCFLTNPEPIYVGNMNYAFECKVVCDSPFAYLPQKIVSASAVDTSWVYFDVYNYSDVEEYTYPEIYLKSYTWDVGTSDDIRIYNSTDNNRYFSIFSMEENEEITIDNDLQIITSTTRDQEDLYGECNFVWLRLLPGNNSMILMPNYLGVLECEVRYSERFKIGG